MVQRLERRDACLEGQTAPTRRPEEHLMRHGISVEKLFAAALQTESFTLCGKLGEVHPGILQDVASSPDLVPAGSLSPRAKAYVQESLGRQPKGILNN